tara:strand:+ start:3642 stop:4691 length:1050 start_codon:yes stop_codon:yes gene_type:complete
MISSHYKRAIQKSGVTAAGPINPSGHHAKTKLVVSSSVMFAWNRASDITASDVSGGSVVNVPACDVVSSFVPPLRQNDKGGTSAPAFRSDITGSTAGSIARQAISFDGTAQSLTASLGRTLLANNIKTLAVSLQLNADTFARGAVFSTGLEVNERPGGAAGQPPFGNGFILNRTTAPTGTMGLSNATSGTVGGGAVGYVSRIQADDIANSDLSQLSAAGTHLPVTAIFALNAPGGDNTGTSNFPITRRADGRDNPGSMLALYNNAGTFLLLSQSADFSNQIGATDANSGEPSGFFVCSGSNVGFDTVYMGSNAIGSTQVDVMEYMGWSEALTEDDMRKVMRYLVGRHHY